MPKKKKNKKLTAGDASRTGTICSCTQLPRRDIPRMMLSLDEAAIATGISRDLLYIPIRTGELPSVLLGRRRLFRVNELQDWVDHLPTAA